MADSFLPLQNVTADYKADTESLSVGVNTVHRERVQIAGALASEITRVRAVLPSFGDYGAVTRPIGWATTGGLEMTDETYRAIRILPAIAFQMTALVPSSGLAIQTATFTLSASGSIVAGTVSQAINVYGLILHANASNDVTLQSGTTNTPPTLLNITKLSTGDNLPAMPYQATPYFTCRSTATATDNHFYATLSGVGQVTGLVFYTKG